MKEWNLDGCRALGVAGMKRAYLDYVEMLAWNEVFDGGEMTDAILKKRKRIYKHAWHEFEVWNRDRERLYRRRCKIPKSIPVDLPALSEEETVAWVESYIKQCRKEIDSLGKNAERFLRSDRVLIFSEEIEGPWLLRVGQKRIKLWKEGKEETYRLKQA